MSVYAFFETSDKLTMEGSPYKLPSKNADGTRTVVYVSRAVPGNQLYQKAVLKHYPADSVNTDFTEEELHQKNVEILVDGLVIGWENMRGRDGEEISFSRENAIRVFSELKEFYWRVRGHADQLQNYLKTAEEEAVKN